MALSVLSNSPLKGVVGATTGAGVGDTGVVGVGESPGMGSKFVRKSNSWPPFRLVITSFVLSFRPALSVSSTSILANISRPLGRSQSQKEAPSDFRHTMSKAF
jgi:hypothetical protein